MIKRIICMILLITIFSNVNGYELVINGNFDYWYFDVDRVSDSWTIIETAEVDSAPGYEGNGLRIKALSTDAGVKTNLPTESGTVYTVSFYHKGGSGRLDILAARSGEIAKTLYFSKDLNWTQYTENWQAVSEGV